MPIQTSSLLTGFMLQVFSLLFLLLPPISLHVFPLHFTHLFLFLLYLSPKFTDLKLLIACFYLALEIKGLMSFSLGNFLILADSQKCDAAIANASDGGIWR